MFFLFFQKTYKLINLLSIDVAVGACTMAYFISNVYETPLPFFTYFILFLTVWVIYTLDHLIDAYQLKNKAIAPRHLFHYHHLRQLIYIVFVASIITFFAIFFLPLRMIMYGFCGCVFVIAHFLLVTLWGNKISFFVQKELSIAVSYTIGVSIPSLSLLQCFEISHFIFLVQCFLLAFTNLCIFSYFDYDIDKKEEQTSIVRLFSMKKTKIVIYGLFFFQFLLNMLFISSIQIVLLLMTLTLLMIFWKYNFFKQNERYRLLGDFVFLYPLILYFFE